MKQSLFVFSLGFLTATLLAVALNYHVVLFPKNEVAFQRKSELTFADSFVDVREWGPVEYVKNPRIAAIAIKRGHMNLIKEGEEASKELVEKGKKAMADTLDKLSAQLKE